MAKSKENIEQKKLLKNKENRSEQLKKSLVRTRNAIQRKFRELHNQKLAIGEIVNETYKPIIEPLKSLVTEAKKKNQVDEPKWQYDQLKHLKNEKLMGSPGVDSSLFKTALPMHRKKMVLPSTSGSSSMHHMTAKRDLSGISRLRWEDYENDDENAGLQDTMGDNRAEDLLAGEDPDAVEQNLVKEIRTAYSPQVESLYGLRTRNGELKLGDDKITIQDDKTSGHYKFCVRAKKFTATPGLTSLLLEVNPKYYTENDLKAYKDMLVYTNAHKKNFSAKETIRRDTSSTKYNRIISQLFPERSRRTPASSSGAGMLFSKKKKPQMDYKIAMKNAKINYTYWDDPNELVDRLRLLLASTSAGHTGHNNEIISIVEELHEAKIIN